MKRNLFSSILLIILFSCNDPSTQKDQKVRDDFPIPLDTVGSAAKSKLKEVDLSGLYGSWSASSCLEKNIVDAPPAAYSLFLSEDASYQLTVSAGYISKGVFKINGDTLSFTEKERYANNEETGEKIPMEFPKESRSCKFELQTGLALCFTPIGKVLDDFPDKCYCR